MPACRAITVCLAVALFALVGERNEHPHRCR
jgi:hypothetical protein